jgi:dihydrofolate reductase
MSIKLIVAVDDNTGIGIDGKLPWPRLKEDMAWFRTNTTNQCVVMGRNTWESLGCKPLPNRENFVVTSGDVVGANKLIINDPEMALKNIEMQYRKDVYIIGGAKLYATLGPFARELLVTRVHGVFKTDTYYDVDSLMNYRWILRTSQTIPPTNETPAYDIEHWRLRCDN